VSFKRLPPDDLAAAKPVGARTLAFVSHFARLNPPHLDFSKCDHDVAFYDEAMRDESRLHILKFRFEPVAHLVVPTQSRAAWGLQLNLRIEQRKKLGNVAPLIEERDPSLHHFHVLLRHRPPSIPEGPRRVRNARHAPRRPVPEVSYGLGAPSATLDGFTAGGSHYVRTMSHALRELREMSREELVEHHDQSATHTLVGVNYYLEDLRQGLAG
jgi:hypothetical protein